MTLSQTDSVLLAIPFIALLAVFVFRLDVLLFRSPAKQVARASRPRFANFDRDGMAMADPDGRVTKLARAQRRPLLRDSVVRGPGSILPR